MSGRNTKLTKVLAENIESNIRNGATKEMAAAAAGISEPTLYNWLNRGRNEQDSIEHGSKPQPKEKIFLEFFKSIKKAEMIYEQTLLKRIETASKESWTAAAWILERRNPKQWGKVEKHEVTGKDGDPIKIKTDKEEMIRKLISLKKQKEGK